MLEEEIDMALMIVNDFVKYDTSAIPAKINTIDYSVPALRGIHKGQWHKNIDEVEPNTLAYIIYHLHRADAVHITDAVIAYLYYWKFRKKDKKKMFEEYKNIKKHYSIQNQNTIDKNLIKMGIGLYLLEITIGAKTLYKVGITEDVVLRISNLKSDIRTSYSHVSVGVKLLDVKYINKPKGTEEKIVEEANNRFKKHKFNFRGSTESFEDGGLISIYQSFLREGWFK